MKIHRVFLALIVAAPSFLLAACSSESGTPSPAAAPAGTPKEEPKNQINTLPPIKE